MWDCCRISFFFPVHSSRFCRDGVQEPAAEAGSFYVTRNFGRLSCGRGIFQYLKATAEPASRPDAEGKSVPSGFQQPHHSAAKLAARLAAKLWDDLGKDGGKLWLNVH